MDMRTDDPYLVFERPHFGPEEIQEVVDSLESGWVGTGEVPFPEAADYSEDQIRAHSSLRAGWSIVRFHLRGAACPASTPSRDCSVPATPWDARSKRWESTGEPR